MIRRAAFLMLAVLAAAPFLAGCAAQGPRSARPAPSTIPAAPPRGEPSAYFNMPAATLRVAFGQPAFIRKDGATEMWRYDGAACRAFFFFYGEAGRQTVRHVETLPQGVAAAADSACLTALRLSAPKTS